MRIRCSKAFCLLTYATVVCRLCFFLHVLVLVVRNLLVAASCQLVQPCLSYPKYGYVIIKTNHHPCRLFVISMQNAEKDAIFCILASILHLGNLHFSKVDVSGLTLADCARQWIHCCDCYSTISQVFTIKHLCVLVVSAVTERTAPRNCLIVSSQMMVITIYLSCSPPLQLQQSPVVQFVYRFWFNWLVVWLLIRA